MTGGVIEQSTEVRGSSSRQCDHILRSQLLALQPQSIVDFGAGGGKNGRLVRDTLGHSCHLTAVEGFGPTAEYLESSGVYDRVEHHSLQRWLEKNTVNYTLGLFGDVLEHLPPRQIRAVLRRCAPQFQYIIIVSPLFDLFQDEVYGNPYEVHRAYLTSTFFDRHDPLEKHIVRGRQYTILNVLIEVNRQRPPIYRRAARRAFHSAMLALQPLGLARWTVIAGKRWLRPLKWLVR